MVENDTLALYADSVAKDVQISAKLNSADSIVRYYVSELFNDSGFVTTDEVGIDTAEADQRYAASDSISLISYVNGVAFDSAYYQDSFATAGSMTVSSDTLFLIAMEYKPDTGFDAGVWTGSEGSPLSYREYNGNYYIISINENMAVGQIRAWFRRR